MWEEHGERGWVDSVNEDLRDDFAVNTDLAPPEGTIPTDVGFRTIPPLKPRGKKAGPFGAGA